MALYHIYRCNFLDNIERNIYTVCVYIYTYIRWNIRKVLIPRKISVCLVKILIKIYSYINFFQKNQNLLLNRKKIFKMSKNEKRIASTVFFVYIFLVPLQRGRFAYSSFPEWFLKLVPKLLKIIREFMVKELAANFARCLLFL